MANAIHGSFDDDSPALGFLELSSIARGLFLTDVVVKKAPVSVIASQPISSGKHVILFVGDVASVMESHGAAVALAGDTLLKQILIPGVHERLAPFLDSIWSADASRSPIGQAVGIVESSSVSGAILAADRALKTADVSLCRMRLGQGIGGKAYFVLTGAQAAVEAATEAAEHCLTEMESLGRVDIIARPQDEAVVHF